MTITAATSMQEDVAAVDSGMSGNISRNFTLLKPLSSAFA